MTRLSDHRRNQLGATSVEYAMMAAGIALGALFMVWTFTVTWQVIIEGAFKHMGNETPAQSSTPPSP